VQDELESLQLSVEETQDWMSLVEGFSKLMEARQHNMFHLPLGYEACKCCGGGEVKVRVALNLSHSVRMRCNANGEPSI
jgi:hypothetical protein